MWRIPDPAPLIQMMSITDAFVQDLLDRAAALQARRLRGGPLQAAVRATPAPLRQILTPKLETFLKRLALCIDLPEVRQQYAQMTQTYQQFLGANAPVYQPSKRTMDLLDETFRYVYKELLPSERFREAYGQRIGLLRPLRHAYLDAIREQITVCPYCNASDIAYDHGVELDHFLAISHFPLLGIHGPNLLPGCKTCNGLRVKGGKFIGTLAGRRVHTPIAHPFWDDVGTITQIHMDSAFGVVTFRFRPGTSAVDRAKAWNFLRVFDLRGKYRSAGYRKRLQDYVLEMRGHIADRYRAGGGNSLAHLEAALDSVIEAEQRKQESYKRDHFLTKAHLDLLELLRSDYRPQVLNFLAGVLGVV